MKCLCSILLLVSIQSIVYGQIVDIPDANFKNALVNTNCVAGNFDSPPDANADVNGDGEIQLSEALLVEHLSIGDQDITDVTGMESFTNLQSIRFSQNPVTTIDFSANTNLINVRCTYNSQLSNINFGSNTNLFEIYVNSNSLTTIDVNNLPNLQFLILAFNEVEQIDLNNNTQLKNLDIGGTLISSIDLSVV